MKINNLELVNFRNYHKIKISFGSGMNIFVGDNAQGKTNILEAITILSLTKSHRIGVNPNIIMFNKKNCKIVGSIKKNKILTKLCVEFTEDTKKLNINNSNVIKVADYISIFNTIIFTPDDLEIIKGSPNIRRNLLNIQLCQLFNNYLKIYNEYNKLLKTRNEYLKILFNNSIADTNYLDIITDKLIEKAVFIYQKRKEYIDLINNNINDFYKKITGENCIFIKYVTNILFDDYDNETIRKKMKYTFKKNYLKELNYGMTIYGPHRDDLIFEYDGKDLKYFGSQGQQKVAILAFKLSEIPIFKDISGFFPVLLLDDIFSELDIKKRNNLLKLVNSYNLQSIITTTDLKNINKKYIATANVYYVQNGNIERR